MKTILYNPNTLEVSVIDPNEKLDVVALLNLQDSFVLATKVTDYEEQAEYMFRAAISINKTHEWTIKSFQDFRDKMNR